MAVPHTDSDGELVVEKLNALGSEVLPALNDPDSDVSQKIKDKLKKHGVGPNDKTKDIAKKLHQVSGFPPLKPSYY